MASATVSWESDTDRDPKTGRFVKQYREFEVMATTTPYHPAHLRADPDDSWPEEGGEVDQITSVEEVFYRGRGRGRWRRRNRYTETSDVATLHELNLYDAAIELLEDDAVNDR